MRKLSEKESFIKNVIQKGYAGVLSDGRLVDRREYPEAIPIQENKIFKTPAPKKIEEKMRKRKVLIVDFVKLLLVLKGELKITNIPEEANIVTIVYDYIRASFNLIIESESFESIEPGAMLPVYYAEFEQSIPLDIEKSFIELKERSGGENINWSYFIDLLTEELG